jgi:hypothetical protein
MSKKFGYSMVAGKMAKRGWNKSKFKSLFKKKESRFKEEKE